MKTLRIGHTGGDRFTMLGDTGQVRAYVTEYGGGMARMDGPGDLSMMPPQALSVLLKFLEELEGGITCYASTDNLPGALASRFDRIEMPPGGMGLGMGGFAEWADVADDPAMAGGRGFAPVAAQHLGSYLLYMKLGRAARYRIGHLL
jgi:hypothetical protein